MTPEEWGPLFQQSMRAGDIDAVLNLYEPEASYTNQAGQVRVGHAGLREELGPLATAKTDFTFKVKKVVQSGDVALIHNAWKTTRPQEREGYALEVLRRQPDGRWLLAIGDPFTIGTELAKGGG